MQAVRRVRVKRRRLHEFHLGYAVSRKDPLTPGTSSDEVISTSFRVLTWLDEVLLHAVEACWDSDHVALNDEPRQLPRGRAGVLRLRVHIA